MAMPKIQVVTLTLADTEYTVDIPDRTSKIMVQARTNVIVRSAWETGKVATPTEPYMTIKANKTYYDSDVKYSYGSKLYLATPTAGTEVEVITHN